MRSDRDAGEPRNACRQMERIEVSRRDFVAAAGGMAACSLLPACSPANRNPQALVYARLVDVARLIKSREISPVELTQAMLERIEALDGRLKSFATLTPDRALAAARAAEEEIGAGTYRGPLHGVPIGLKDLC